jgi:hypothetical protein
MARLTRHERPLSKTEEHGNNPNKIIFNQHVIPNKHILEWSPDGKMVVVYDIEGDEFKNLPTVSPYFCVMRLWDQWTESVMLKSNEDNYQSQVELMRKELQFTNSEYVMAYYVSLCVRIWVANKERPHYPSNFSTISHEYNKSELEDNELEMEGHVHIVNSTIDADSQHMARQVVKMAMNQAFIQWCDKIKGQAWKVYQSNDEHFILSDALYTNYLSGFHVLPVSPKQVLIAESTYEFLDQSGSLSVQFINKTMERNAINFYIKYAGSEAISRITKRYVS